MIRALAWGKGRLSTVSITLDTYSHAIPTLEEEAAAKVARLAFGG